MPLRDKHKNLIYSRMCDRCGKTYTGHGKQFCSTNCANSDYKTVQERFWSKVNIKSENECWEWIKFKNKKGYGLFGLNAIPEGHTEFRGGSLMEIFQKVYAFYTNVTIPHVVIPLIYF
jgi:hypothetical protein